LTPNFWPYLNLFPLFPLISSIPHFHFPSPPHRSLIPLFPYSHPTFFCPPFFLVPSHFIHFQLTHVTLQQQDNFYLSPFSSFLKLLQHTHGHRQQGELPNSLLYPFFLQIHSPSQKCRESIPSIYTLYTMGIHGQNTPSPTDLLLSFFSNQKTMTFSPSRPALKLQ